MDKDHDHGGSARRNLTIVLPTYNESQNLRQMVRACLGLTLREQLRILVVDDNSTDGTGSIADALARQHPGIVQVLHRPGKQGLGPAYAAGFTRALADGADLVLQMDCDFSHLPDDIPALLAASETADVVIGSRFVAGGRLDPQWPRSRKLLSRFANGCYVRAVLGTSVHDATSGFRLWHRHALTAIDPDRHLTLNGYGFQVEMVYLARKLGLRIKEVPVYFPERTQGASKMSMKICLEAALKIPALRWRHWGRGIPAGGRAAAQGTSIRWLPGLSRGALAVLSLMFVSALGLRLLAMGNVVLIPEEAYYWLYSQHPNLSYFDHPPMIAWIIGLGTAVFGNNEFGVRIVGNLMMIASSLLLYRFGSIWFGRKAGILSALLIQILPVYYGAGFIATMDAALIFFWLLCLLGVSLALKLERPHGWYLAGLALGGAMLSKYTGVFLGAGALLAVMGHPPWRRHLRTAHPYLAAMLGMIVFSPVIVWNAEHAWASFRFQFIERFADAHFHIHFVLSFLLFQLVVLTPQLLGGFGGALGAVMRRKGRRLLEPRWLIAVSFSLPLLAVMAYKSVRSDIHINWTLPIFLSLFPALSHMLLIRMRRSGRRIAGRHWWHSGAYATAIGCLAVNLIGVVFLMTLQPRLRLISAFGPWKELAAVVQDYNERLHSEEEPLVVADGKYRLASVVAFYRRPLEDDVDAADYTTSQWILGGSGLAFPYWTNPEKWKSRNVVYVVDDRSHDILKAMQHSFRSVELVDDPRLRRLGADKYRLAIGRSLLKVRHKG